METFHEAHHGLCAPAFSLSDDGDPALVVGNFFPHERLSGAEMELLSESRWHGNLAAFSQSCQSAIHNSEEYHVKLSCQHSHHGGISAAESRENAGEHTRPRVS